MTAGLVRGDGVFPPAAYERDDESPDDRFYTVPRKVVHIDDGAIGALGRLYAEMLPARGRLLDLMSSWRSHVPAGHAATIVGLGLNAEEMADNPQLASHVLRPNGTFVVSFSNRCFPTKAVAVWLGTTDVQHVALVRTYFEATGGWTDIRAEDRSPGGGDPLYAVWARAAPLPS